MVYDYEDGLKDHCIDDPLWAADKIEELEAEVAQLRNELLAQTNHLRNKPTMYYGYK